MALPLWLVPLPFVVIALLSLLGSPARARLLGYASALGSLLSLIFLFFSDTLFYLPWFSVGDYSFAFSLARDGIATLFAGIVAGIGTLVFLYSVGYFEHETGLRRYYALMNLFAASMIIAVLAHNLFVLLFAWEIVGITSYLLIGFWHERAEAVVAARKALMTIIIGDALFLFGVLTLAIHYRTLEIGALLGSLRPDGLTLLAGLGILAAALTKSAQFPFHDWLPDAMAGPTPVSAFLHSAAMVKAGIYLLARFLPLLAITGLLPLVIVLGLITLLLSAGSALVETDIKRVLAYSTINHLSIMVLALGVGALAASLFHVLAHSIFKALLFFAAGIAIHVSGTQDLRKMRIGFGWSAFAIATLLGAFALAGLAPLVGFFSKEGVFSAIARTGSWEIVALFSLGVLLSSAYIVRWLLLLFHPRGKKVEAPWQMRAPLPLLALGCVLGGLAAGPLTRALGAEAEHGIVLLAISSTLLTIGGALAAALVMRRRFAPWLAHSVLAEAFRHRVRMDALGDHIAQAIARLAGKTAWAENAIVNRSIRIFSSGFVHAGERLRKLHTGQPRAYIVAVLLGFALIALALGVLG